jgi:hypothetical protein
MSLWKQNKIKKQQRKKRARKVFKARDEVLSLLAADKVKKAEETASALLVKHPGDIRKRPRSPRRRNRRNRRLLWAISKSFWRNT